MPGFEAAMQASSPATVSTESAYLQVQSLSKVYPTDDGPVRALDKVSIEQRKGEFVLADADLAFAASRIASAGFEASGQQCISAQRVLVDRSVLGDFLPLFVKAARSLKVGPASDAATDVGPMVHAAAAERVMAMVADAVERGAKLALAPEQNGATISPGILTGVTRGSRLWNEEVFGPIVVVTAFDGADQAIELANDSDFGLQGAVFTRSLAHAMRFADDMDVGSLWINEASRFRLDMYPFGGSNRAASGAKASNTPWKNCRR